MILLIDNYDSFVFNLARYFERLGQATLVVRNDALDAEQAGALGPRAIVLSPGPCTPHEAGCSLEMVRRWHEQIPILGICLGHQTIAAALGGKIVRSPEPVHGRADSIFHDGQGVFAGIPSPFSACRYHSLAVDEASLPASLTVCARNGQGLPMALARRSAPLLVGLQFHPESILTDHGYAVLANYLRMINLPLPAEIPGIDSERVEPVRHESATPASPVTF